MTFAGSMHAGEDRVHGANPRVTSNAPHRDAIADAHAAISVCRRLERTDDGCPNGNDTPTFRLYVIDC